MGRGNATAWWIMGGTTALVALAAMATDTDQYLNVPTEPLPLHGRFVPAKRTPITPANLAPIVIQEFKARTGRSLDKRQIATLLAQWAAETGWGRAVWNHNFGNVKAGRDYTEFFTVLPTWEYHVRNGVLKRERWNAPFRAFNTPDKGVRDWLGILLGKRHGRSLQFILNGDPEGLGRSLGNVNGGGTGYATATPEKYGAALAANYAKIAAAIA